MATADQVAKLGTDLDALFAAYDQKIADLVAKLTAATAPVADPAIDALDAKVTAATEKITAPAP